MSLPKTDNHKQKDNLIMTQNQNETNLILKLRTKYRYGEVIIVMHDGICQRIKEIRVFDDLHNNLTED